MTDGSVPDVRTQPVLRDEELQSQIGETEIHDGEVGLWWLTQASWLVKFASCTVAIDPWWRDINERDVWGKLLGEYPLRPEELPFPD